MFLYLTNKYFELNWIELNWIELNWIELNWSDLNAHVLQIPNTDFQHPCGVKPNPHYEACDVSGFILISGSACAWTFSWKKRSSYQGKKEVACIVSKPLVSCLWGDVKHLGDSGGFVLSIKRRPRPVTHFLGFLTSVKSQPWFPTWHHTILNRPS